MTREHVARSVEVNAREMKFVTEELTLLGVCHTLLVGNFLLIDTGRDCQEEFLRLLHEGVIVRPLAGFGAPEAIRVTVGTPEENAFFGVCLGQVLSGVS